MNFMSIVLNMSGRRVVIIGGGHVALRKARNLMPHCRELVIVSSAFIEGFSDIDGEKIQMELGSVSQLDDVVRNDDLVIIATDDHVLNDMISEYCNSRQILFNSVDDGSSPFIFPATYEENGLIISVSTSGKSPSLTRFLRDRIKEDMAVYFAALPVAEKLRSSTAIADIHVRATFFRDLFARKEFWELIAADRMEEAFAFGMKVAEEYK